MGQSCDKNEHQQDRQADQRVQGKDASAGRITYYKQDENLSGREEKEGRKK